MALLLDDPVNVSVQVYAESKGQADAKAKALSQLSTLSLKDLQWLAQASKKPGIDKKLQMAKKFI